MEFKPLPEYLSFMTAVHLGRKAVIFFKQYVGNAIIPGLTTAPHLVRITLWTEAEAPNPT